MNATKRLLTVAAITAGALGIGAGAFFACRQELSPGAQDGSASAERRPSHAKYDDGVYDFYFRNGAHVREDCDGYNSEPSGKTTIYEYWKSDINEWEKRLKKAGVNPEMHKTSKPGKYCWVRFDTSLLAGIGYEGYSVFGVFGQNFYDDDQFEIIVENGLWTKLKPTVTAYYAQAHSDFSFDKVDLKRFSENTKTWLKQDRNTPAICIVFGENGVEDRDNARQTLEAMGIPTLDTGKEEFSYIFSDASNIKWFAYNQ